MRCAYSGNLRIDTRDALVRREAVQLIDIPHRMRTRDVLDHAHGRGIALNRLKFLVFQYPVNRPDAVGPFRVPERGKVIEIAGVVQEERRQ